MPGRLEGKVCVITGATGIAEATAIMAVKEGARVFIMNRTPEHGAALTEQLGSLGAECDRATVDLVDSERVSAAIDRAKSRFGRIDSLFNVAGISGRRYGDGPIHECSEAGWDMTMSTNVKTMFLVCRSVVRTMREQTPGANGLRGTILNMSSVLGFSPSPKYFATHAYAASKGAINSLSQSMAAHYAAEKIRVNVIAPGLVRTPMSQRAQENDLIQGFMKTKQPLREEMISAESVARLAVFLLSDEAADITGEVVSVDAGWHVSEGQS